MIDPHAALERSRRNLIALTCALADPRLSHEGRRQVRAMLAKQAAFVMHREKILRLAMTATVPPDLLPALLPNYEG